MLKELHAYKNEDDTYRVEGIGFIMYDGELRETKIEMSRAKLDINPFQQIEDNTTFIFEIKENTK